jgi:hypothetical protein
MKASKLNARWRHQGLPYQLEQYGSASVWAICRPRHFDDRAIIVLYGEEADVVSQAKKWLKHLRRIGSAKVIQFQPSEPSDTKGKRKQRK